MIKIWRSWKSAFGEFYGEYRHENDEAWTSLDIYTEAELERIRNEGFNAVWIHAQLNNLVRTDVFPELGTDAEQIQKRLNILMRRAEKHGLGVYLYLQIPRGLRQDHPLWKQHPECAGLPDMYPDAKGRPVIMLPMCTSVEKTRVYLEEASRELARKLPLTAGVILITASEYPSHCYGRGGRIPPGGNDSKFIPTDCPRCTGRSPAEVISEIIGLVASGIHAESPRMQVIAWNWSWTFFEESPCRNIIRSLPEQVSLMVDFERGGQRKNGMTVEEYSLGYAGPSERFLQICAEAEQRGMELFAKFQIGTTHELAVVPNLPLMENIRRKACRFAELNLKGFMGCWNFGNMPSANVAGFQYFLAHPQHTLEEFAAEYFPGGDPVKIAEAWRLFTAAMEDYPLSNPWLYFGPTNFSPALPLLPGVVSGNAGGRSWLPDAERGENIAKAFKLSSPDDVIRAFERIVPLWEKGIALFRDGIAASDSPHAKEELSSTLACGLLFRSSLHCVRSYQLKIEWSESRMTEWRRIVSAEWMNLKRLLPVVEQDRRIGYHIEAHEYLFTALHIRRKIEMLKPYVHPMDHDGKHNPFQ